MAKTKTLDQLRAEKEQAEAQLLQEQHKLQRLEQRKKHYEKGERKKRTHRLCNLGGMVESVGQNHIALFAEAAKKIDMSNAGPYDQGITESFQAAFKDYFTGNVDEDTAKENFKTSVQEKYPELTDVVWPA